MKGGGISLSNINYIFIFIMIIFAAFIFFQYHINSKLNQKISNINRIKDSLYYVADKVSMTSNEQEIYKHILDAAVELIPGASKGSILIIEGDGKFHFKAVKGFTEKLKDMTLEKEEIFLYNLNNFTETAIIENPMKLDEDIVTSDNIASLKNLNVLSMSCTISSPIYIDGNLIGIINVDSTENKRVFSNEDKALMNYIRNELQLALKNSFIKSSLTYLANFDELTGIFNRRYFRQILEIELNRIKEENSEACIVFIDVDDFKYINDTYGHSAGDDALRMFSDILKNSIRSTDIYARMSGDEFVVLFLGCNEAVAAERMINIRNRLSKEKFGKVKIDFSYGITYINKDIKLTSDSILNEADRKMYENKRCKVIRSIR